MQSLKMTSVKIHPEFSNVERLGIFGMTGFFGFLAYLQRAIFCISTNSQNQVGIAIIPITTGHSIGAANRTLVMSVHMN